jgi:hypothetical protein
MPLAIGRKAGQSLLVVEDRNHAALELRVLEIGNGIVRMAFGRGSTLELMVGQAISWGGARLRLKRVGATRALFIITGRRSTKVVRRELLGDYVRDRRIPEWVLDKTIETASV